MKLSSSAWRVLLTVVALLAAFALASCTGFKPVYGTGGVGDQRVEIKYGDPNNRLEQIIYDDLALKLGKAEGGATPTLYIAAYPGAAGLTSGVVVSPKSEAQATVTANIQLVASDGQVLFSGSRSQTADYTNGPQAFANEETFANATEQAAHLLADTIRLQVLAMLIE